MPEPLTETGSSVTIVPAARIEKFGTAGIAEALRDVAGVEVTNTGGVGATTTVSIRGSQRGQVLVLLDGIRIGNPTDTDGAVDFGSLSAVDVERIEMLRGPQSALYGSDAMGGVINIITRKGAKDTRRTVTVEGGSYGRIATRATQSGTVGDLSYSIGLNALHTDGFPQFGYRISPAPTLPSGSPLPTLPTQSPDNLGGLAARFSYHVNDELTIDLGGNLFGNGLRFSNPYAFVTSDVFSPFNYESTLIGLGYARIFYDPKGSNLTNQLTVYTNSTTFNNWETESCYDINYNAFNCRSGYVGWRYGVEYQGDLNFGPYGGLTFGARRETETASTNESPNPNDGSFIPINAAQTTNSVFGEDRIDLFKRLNLTLGGRIDSIESGDTFGTFRATAAYHIDETGTKFRASVGTGAREPSLYQRFSPYGTSDLAPERSFGYDVGVDQKLYNDNITLSASYFHNNYTDLISFADVSSCTFDQLSLGGCYYNVSKASTEGVELSADGILVPGQLSAEASYTYTRALDLGDQPGDLDAGLQLYHIPLTQGSLSFTYFGIPKLQIEPRLLLVGSRLDENFVNYPYGDVTLGAYARLDLYVDYQVNDNLKLFGKAINLTNADYQEVYDYGTAARSFYAGLTYSW